MCMYHTMDKVGDFSITTKHANRALIALLVHMVGVISSRRGREDSGGGGMFDD